VTLTAGETKRVVFSVPPEAFALWNDQKCFTVEPAHATIWISGDSASRHGNWYREIATAQNKTSAGIFSNEIPE